MTLSEEFSSHCDRHLTKNANRALTLPQILNIVKEIYGTIHKQIY
ncbi:hypothetical protein [Fischerella sp. PCC 9605]|nr:hypothetical protein [Fischerella sp. PCC 9605]